MEASSSDDETEMCAHGSTPFVSMSAIGQPYCRYQGSYLFNLLKLLNEAEQMQVTHVFRWHTKILNALEINWKLLTRTDIFEEVHPVLVKYKLSRASNRPSCVRPTMNRKLREWNFSMIPTHTSWITYVYHNKNFNAFAQHGELPTCRRH